MRALLLVFLIISQVGFAQEALLEKLRTNIREVFQTDSVCFDLYESLEVVDLSNNNTLKAYKGAVELGMARHHPNPFKKMGFFSDGKDNLDEAIEADNENIELRFLRLTIQTYLPTFLGYSGNIESDKSFVLSNLEMTNNPSFEKQVRGFIAQAEENGKL